MDLKGVLQLQATLLVFLGAVVLLAHQTSRTRDANAGARWFFAASLCGGMGLALQAKRGELSPVLTVVAGNLLFLLLSVFLTRSIELAVQAKRKTMPFLLALAVITAGLLAYFTFPHPNATARVLTASIALPVLLMPSIVLLLSSRQRAIRAATWTLAGILLFYSLTCLTGIVAILRGAHPTTGVRWTGAILISGVALCFLWMDLLRMRAELEQQAMTDPLTGLLNRRALEMLGERELARAARRGTAVSLLTIDIDHFKSINDRYGHMVGDAALVGVATVLRHSTRQQDLTVRTGGDEFVVLLTESSGETAESMVGRITRQVAALALESNEGERFHVSVTVGSHTSTAGARHTYAELAHASDVDLYQRKQQRDAVKSAPLLAFQRSSSGAQQSSPEL